ncbi:hypothetical protein B0A48_01920 [Cryoendolithus antarcticus]|uniref:NADP-dependent oxidoreductase domain-containing protein n=1 Tax=Cryoendolithus antarcticus TaxID=1507870 RepID=A0A1V8TR09_9PEZI|nr:hypothetical protein B0A48_01920 [Cryoendolithus antarcticus]
MKLTVSLISLAVASGALAPPSGQIPFTGETPKPMTREFIPLLGFGTWNLDRSNASEAVSFAIQSGFRHIDCAAAYGNEELVGKGIADGLAKTGLSREDLWITSKLWNDHHGAKNVPIAIATSLEKLGIDYLDLYHIHWPVSSKDKKNHVGYKSTYAAMTKLLETGQVKHLGVCNFSPYQLDDLLNSTSHPPSVHQMELHPYLQQNEWIDWHSKHGIHVTAYSPFAGANPTYDPGEPPQLLHNDVTQRIAKKRNCTPAQVLLVWGISRGTSVIPKSSHADRIVENVGALTCKLEKSDVQELDGLGKWHHRFVNPSKSWGVDLYEGLEDSKGKHTKSA